MVRTVIGAAVGAVVGMLILAGCGAWYGYENGVETARVPPGWDAAARSALIWCVFLFWLAIPAGAVLGGAVGLSSWLLRPTPARGGHAHPAG
jgi:hypothetical protein